MSETTASEGSIDPGSDRFGDLGAPGSVSRRGLLAIGWSAICAWLAGAFSATVRFFFPRALLAPSTVFKAGLASDLTVGKVDETFLRSHRVWIVREAGSVHVLLARCTHLGCTPVWREPDDLFRCPCHGSVFTREGLPVEGPAPRPLERVGVELDDEGRLVIDTGVVYRRELGQWSDPAASVRVG